MSRRMLSELRHGRMRTSTRAGVVCYFASALAAVRRPVRSVRQGNRRSQDEPPEAA